MSLPTVAVTIIADLCSGVGLPNGIARFTPFRFDTSPVPAPNGGLVLAASIDVPLDANGMAVGQIFPNASGTQANQYRVEFFKQGGVMRVGTALTCYVPAQPCNLHEILTTQPPPPLTDAQVAVLACQNYVASAGAAQTAAAASKTAADADAAATAGDRVQTGLDHTATAGSATAAAGSSAAASASATAAAGSATTATTQAGNASASATVATTQAGVATTQAGTATTQAGLAAASKAAADADAAATAGDRVQTGLDRAATGASTTAAAASATSAAASASAASVSATTAGSASSLALAVYGTSADLNAAQQIMLGYATTATAQANLAQGFASSTAITQQDLSGVTAAALHRSPNAIVALFIYDTSKDSDGGAWVERCQQTSWYNEALNGAWLGACASEAAARAVTGAATGNYFQLTTDGKFYALNAGAGTTEVFRGNVAKFPRLSAVVAEVSRVAIYDLTQPGRPMWMVFRSDVSPAMIRGSNSNGSVAALNGEVVVGVNAVSGDIHRLRFVADGSITIGLNAWLTYNGGIAQRNNSAIGFTTVTNTGVFLPNRQVNAVAMTVLPDAPVDPVTGLQVPTIAAMTAGGVSVIKHDGSVSNHAFTYNVNDSLQFSDNSLFYGNLNNAWGPRYIRVNDITGSTFLGSGFSAGLATYSGTVLLCGSKKTWFSRYLSTVVNLRVNEANPAASIRADVAPTYNTGWMTGDIRRAWLSDTVAGTVANTELVTNGTFDTDVSGWSAPYQSSVTWDAGTLRVTAVGGTNPYGQQAISGLTIGKTYRFTAPMCARSDSSVWQVALGNVAGLYQTQYSGTVPVSSGPVSILFTATTTVLNIQLLSLLVPVGQYANFDNISVQEVIADRSYKNKPLTVYGTLAKTAVAAAAQLMFFSGFTNDATFAGEKVVNGAFATNLSSWTVGAGVTWSVGTVSFAAGSGFLEQGVPTVAGRAYVVTGTNTGNAVWGGAWKTSGQNTLLPDLSGAGSAAVRGGSFSFIFVAQGSTSYIAFSAGGGGIGTLDNVSVMALNAVGTTANVAQEPYSANWDFGTGAWRVGAWVNVPAVLPNASFPVIGSELATNGDFSGGSTGWAMTGGWAVAGGVASNSGAPGQIVQNIGVIGKAYKITFDAGTTTTINGVFGTNFVSINPVVGTNIVIGLCVGSVSLGLQGGGPYTGIDNISIKEVGISCIFDRSAVTGPYIRAGILPGGFFSVEAYDGTTTRRAVSTSVYNNATSLKASFEYTTDGTLRIGVNGTSVGSTTGAPLLTLNNATAVTTVGNSRTLDAAFPGSIALLKPTATVPTLEQKAFMFAQENAMFQPGAQVTLPDSGAVVDLDYDASQDLWKVVSAANESAFTGLVRSSSSPVSAGSFIKVSHKAGVKLLARSTTNPGVDITVPALGLMSELFNRAERAAALARLEEAFDYTAGFTGTTVSGSTAISSVAGMNVPATVNLRGIPVSGTGITVGAVILDIVGTTVYIDKPATASNAGVQISMTDIPLPTGYEVKSVLSAGASKQEGATKDWTRVFDGFIERERFAVAPGYAAWVQLKARRTVR